MENHSKILFDSLKTRSDKQNYEQENGGGSYARLYEAASPGAGQSTLNRATMTRPVFESMDYMEQASFVRGGGTVVDSQNR